MLASHRLSSLGFANNLRFTDSQSDKSHNGEANAHEMPSSSSQIQEELRKARLEITRLSILLSSYQERLDEQSVDKEMLEINLDQHKEDLVTKLRELDNKQYVIAAQGFLLNCAREEVQGLFAANSEKDQTISDLRVQIQRESTTNEGSTGGKKRKIAP